MRSAAADSFPLEIDGHLDAVGDFDDRDTLVHPEVLTIEGHCANDGPLARVSFSGLVTSRIVKSPSNSSVVGSVWTTLVE